MNPSSKWPKTPPPLSKAQLAAREAYMKLWHERLPQKYALIERFNHRYPASLPIARGTRTLEIGAGLGEHLKYEDLSTQEYYCVELREAFCEEIRRRHPGVRVLSADIERGLPFDAGSFDRVVAIHVLEHLRNLPAALKEIKRLLTPSGCLDVVIPCEGGLTHTVARKISAQRLFEKTFKMPFGPIHANEHVNTYREIRHELSAGFRPLKRRMFPWGIGPHTVNLCAGFRYTVV